MTEQEIATILNIGPFEKVAKLCHDRELLLTVIALSYQKGKMEGMREAHDDVNRIFKSIAGSGAHN